MRRGDFVARIERRLQARMLVARDGEGAEPEALERLAVAGALPRGERVALCQVLLRRGRDDEGE